MDSPFQYRIAVLFIYCGAKGTNLLCERKTKQESIATRSKLHSAWPKDAEAGGLTASQTHCMAPCAVRVAEGPGLRGGPSCYFEPQRGLCRAEIRTRLSALLCRHGDEKSFDQRVDVCVSEAGQIQSKRRSPAPSAHRVPPP